MDSLTAVLRQLCRAYVTGEDVGTPRDLFALIDLARRHRVAPIVAGLVEPRLQRTDPLSAVLRRERRLATAHALVLGALAEEVLGALAAAGVPALVLKGLALGARYYRSPEHRPMRDVDLLVRRGDLDAALAVAARLGLTRYADRHGLAFDRRFGSALVLTRTPDDLTRPSVDLHWRLLDDWRYGRAEGWEERVWDAPDALAVGAARAQCPAPGVMLVHLAAHLALHHAFEGLLWYVDLALVAARLREPHEWDAVSQLAARLGVTGAVALALEATESLLGVGAPPRVLVALGAERPRLRLARRLVLRRARALQPTAHLEHLLPLLLADGVRRCATAVARTVAPPPAWVRLRYDRSPWPGGYAHHLGAGVALLGRTIERALPLRRTAG